MGNLILESLNRISLDVNIPTQSMVSNVIIDNGGGNDSTFSQRFFSVSGDFSIK